MTHVYKTKGTCSSEIRFDLDGETVYNIRFAGGCPGNLQAIQALADGQSVEQLERKLKGIRCGYKSTSCADQLATAIRQAYEEETNDNARAI